MTLRIEKKKQKWVQRKLLRTIFLSRRADEIEKGVNLKMEHRHKFLLKKSAAKAKKNSFICTFAFYSFKLLLFFQAIVMCFSFLVYISVIRLISFSIEKHPYEKKKWKNEKKETKNTKTTVSELSGIVSNFHSIL